MPLAEGEAEEKFEDTISLIKAAKPPSKGPRIISDVKVCLTNVIETAKDREGNIVMRITRAGLASSADGRKDRGTPKPTRKGPKGVAKSLGGGSTPVSGTSGPHSAPTTAGYKRKNISPTKEGDEGGVMRPRTNPVRRTLKTPRRNDAGSRGEVGSPSSLMPPPATLQTKLKARGTSAPREEQLESKENWFAISEKVAGIRMDPRVINMDSSGTDDDHEETRTEQEEEGAMRSASSIDSMASLKVDPLMAGMTRSAIPPKRGPGRPRITGQYVGLVKAKDAEAESTQRLADGKLEEEVTDKLSLSVRAYTGEGGVEMAPIGDIMNSIEESLEAIYKV